MAKVSRVGKGNDRRSLEAIEFRLRQMAKAPLKVIDGYRDGARDMPGSELTGRSGIENYDVAFPSASEQFIHLDGFRIRTIANVLSNNQRQVCVLLFRDSPQYRTELNNTRIGKPVRHEEPLLE